MAKEDLKFNTVLESTCGILFFGTLHRGANGTAEIAGGIFLGNIFDTLSKASMARLAIGRTRTDLLQSLQVNSPDLLRVTKFFRSLCGMLRIVTVFETWEEKGLGRLVRCNLIKSLFLLLRR